MNRRILAPLLVLLAITGLFAAGCGDDDSGGAATTATTATTAAASGAADLDGVKLRVAQVGKSLSPILEYAGEDDTPYELEWSSFDAAPPVIQALQGDAADIGISSDLGVISAVGNGSPIKAVAATEVPGVGQQILVPRGSSIRSIADLRGKKIAVFRGSAGEGFLAQALKNEGLSADDVEITNLPPAQAAAAFNSGNVDAWAIWEPMATSTVLTAGAEKIADGSEFWRTRSFIDANPKALDDEQRSAAIADFLERFARSTRYLAANRAGWARKFAEVNRIDQAVADQAAEALSMELIPVDGETAAKLRESQDLYLEVGAIRRTIDPDELLVPTFTDNINAGLAGGN
ncbi:aliphatic sulfonate ABC transporter substrate-binding protein [Conexibacter sp. CPCC 206217]|uniref:aliphatic sulfonate ABC transporter substrate-binding protein n=1 Tax=Conexibacter sp. CPCC 206217 TaxID=3064574 RepID=UPI002716A0D0|nr:aliphatic sulfonate ABC transporter substrate-binding protein [Conexibacter sp. CPCC 206217]MDO8212139.1 aliphatic sulfonate ABC transporter substrate-binding protein [Conexibacter sp. CPCC 206217]